MRGRVNAIRTFKGLVADLRVIKKYVFLSLCLRIICLLLNQFVLLLLCLQNPMYLCLTQKPHPVRRPPLCRRGAGGEAVPRKRENQINTLVLKDINFTINIIELSYYRTIDTLNQSFKMLPWHVYLEAEPVIRNVFLYHSA